MSVSLNIKSKASGVLCCAYISAPSLFKSHLILLLALVGSIPVLSSHIIEEPVAILTLPFTINPLLNLPVPFTSSLCVGVVVPMPTRELESILITSVPPSTKPILSAAGK